jgi:hypothetical protein
MSIDIKFLKQLPDTFVQQQPTLAALKEMDIDGDDEITQVEAMAYLRSLRNGKTALSESEMVEKITYWEQIAESTRQVIETQTVSIKTLLNLDLHQRAKTKADYLIYQVDKNQDFNIDAKEIRSALISQNPELSEQELDLYVLLSLVKIQLQMTKTPESFISWLKMTAHGNWIAEYERGTKGWVDKNGRPYQGKPSRMNTLIHVLTYVPAHIFHPVDGWNNLWSHGPTTAYSWRRSVMEMANLRKIYREEAIYLFEKIWSEYPDAKVEEILKKMNEKGLQDRVNVLVHDLRILDWSPILQAKSPEEKGEALLYLVQKLLDGRSNILVVNGIWNSFCEHATTPDWNVNYHAAQSILEVLAEEKNDWPKNIKNRAEAAIKEMKKEGKFRYWKDANDFQDWIFAGAVELAITAGVFKVLKWVGGGIWGLTGARGTAWLASKGGNWAKVAEILGHTPPATASGTAEALTAGEKVWKAAGTTLRVFNKIFYVGYLGTSSVALNSKVTPQKKGSYEPDYSLKISLPENP